MVWAKEGWIFVSSRDGCCGYEGHLRNEVNIVFGREVYGWVDIWTDVRTDVWMYVWVGRWMDVWMDDRVCMCQCVNMFSDDCSVFCC